MSIFFTKTILIPQIQNFGVPSICKINLPITVFCHMYQNLKFSPPLHCPINRILEGEFGAHIVHADPKLFRPFRLPMGSIFGPNAAPRYGFCHKKPSRSIDRAIAILVFLRYFDFKFFFHEYMLQTVPSDGPCIIHSHSNKGFPSPC